RRRGFIGAMRGSPDCYHASHMLRIAAGVLKRNRAMHGMADHDHVAQPQGLPDPLDVCGIMSVKSPAVPVRSFGRIRACVWLMPRGEASGSGRADGAVAVLPRRAALCSARDPRSGGRHPPYADLVPVRGRLLLLRVVVREPEG